MKYNLSRDPAGAATRVKVRSDFREIEYSHTR
jgi:hypothetical protein